jgi:hypothetical protein
MPTPTALPASFSTGQVLTAADMNLLRGGFRILTVNSVTKTDTFSTTSSTLVDITGLSLTITPQSNTSKFILFASINFGNNGPDRTAFAFSGGNSSGSLGATAGSRVSVTSEASTAAAAAMGNAKLLYLDSPATASAVTYKVQMRSYSGGTMYINRSFTDSDNSNFSRTSSTLTVLEVSA